MRKLITTAFVSVDGVMQAPGAPDEDRSSGFAHGGWMVPYRYGAFSVDEQTSTERLFKGEFSGRR